MSLEKFICKNELGEGRSIAIPENAHYLRLKSGYALFYTDKSGQNNGFIEIPEKSAKVIFPQFRKHCYHIEYGEPSFQK